MIQLSSQEFLWIIIAEISGVCVAWIALFWALRGQGTVLTKLFSEGFFLRMITVVFIVCAAGTLALGGRLSAELATILAGIAGFVLGGVDKKQEPQRSSSDEATSKPAA